MNEIVYAYNNSYHDFVEMTPNEADEDKNYEIVLFNIFSKRREIHKKDMLKKGKKVRLYMK